ncbi:uncharacterized protein V1510DRAFT_247025 [Dipodascopsis tothii]|uniref:uncharacterized protein n=1 Tax=Dipodascopsis tothii TaxID=44089 RepID=UPI0034CEB18E
MPSFTTPAEAVAAMVRLTYAYMLGRSPSDSDCSRDWDPDVEDIFVEYEAAIGVCAFVPAVHAAMASTMHLATQRERDERFCSIMSAALSPYATCATFLPRPRGPNRAPIPDFACPELDYDDCSFEADTKATACDECVGKATDDSERTVVDVAADTTMMATHAEVSALSALVSSVDSASENRQEPDGFYPTADSPIITLRRQLTRKGALLAASLNTRDARSFQPLTKSRPVTVARQRVPALSLE